MIARLERRSTRGAGRARRVRAERELPEREGGRHGVRRRSGGASPSRGRARARATQRPLFVKLSPTLPDIARRGADRRRRGRRRRSRVVNTIPGLVIDVERRRPALGFGTGGVSGPAILPVGVLATWKVRRAVKAADHRRRRGVHGRRMRCSTSWPARRSSASAPPRCAIRARPSGSCSDSTRGAQRTASARIADVVGTLEWPDERR